MKKLKKALYEPKTNIGWVHGLTACFTALICSYLTMMIYTSIIEEDYVYKILPSLVLTPILISIYGLYFLFSKKLSTLLKKSFLTIFVLAIFFILTLKVI